jgi:hypothetical protein
VRPSSDYPFTLGYSRSYGFASARPGAPRLRGAQRENGR